MWIEAIYIVNEIILLVSSSLSITGIILLRNLKQPFTNQRTFLTSFSSSELYFAVKKFLLLLSIQIADPSSIYHVITKPFAERHGLFTT